LKKLYNARNEDKNSVLFKEGLLATTFWQRLRGLLGRPPLPAGGGLVLKGDKIIHTFLMGFPIDVVYLDREGRVTHLTENMAPQRIGPFVGDVAYILELPVGTIARTATAVGDRVSFADHPVDR
jgi:uncharacterized membrane protein (UPF0127 family)